MRGEAGLKREPSGPAGTRDARLKPQVPQLHEMGLRMRAGVANTPGAGAAVSSVQERAVRALGDAARIPRAWLPAPRRTGSAGASLGSAQPQLSASQSTCKEEGG